MLLPGCYAATAVPRASRVLGCDCWIVFVGRGCQARVFWQGAIVLGKKAAVQRIGMRARDPLLGYRKGSVQGAVGTLAKSRVLSEGCCQGAVVRVLCRNCRPNRVLSGSRCCRKDIVQGAVGTGARGRVLSAYCCQVVA